MFGWVSSLNLFKVLLCDALYTDCTDHVLLFFFSRYNNDLELEDAIHTAILTLKVCSLFKSIKSIFADTVTLLFFISYLHSCVFVFQESFEGQMTEENIEVGICNEAGFKRLTPAEVKDYLAAIA